MNLQVGLLRAGGGLGLGFGLRNRALGFGFEAPQGGFSTWGCTRHQGPERDNVRNPSTERRLGLMR